MGESIVTLPVLRRSAIQSAKSCLHRFNQIWNLGVPDSNDYSLRGIAFHACAHRYIERLVQCQLPADEEEAKAAFSEGIAAALTPAHLVPEVRGIYMKWAENFGLDLEAFVTAEEHQIGNNQQVFTPDLVYARPTGLEIVDFKTFFQPMTEAQVRSDWQARWYSYNAHRIWKNFPQYAFVQSYVRYGTSTRVVFTPGDLATFADEVTAIAETIRNRAAQRGLTPAQVVMQPKQYSFWNDSAKADEWLKKYGTGDAYQLAAHAYEQAFNEGSQTVDGATHYYNPRKVREIPKFAREYERKGKVGNHEFFFGA